MKNVLIAGSSGMIGNLILAQCLERQDVDRVTIINRRASGFLDTKLTEVVHNDFSDLTRISSTFINQDICFYCIGVYTGQVPRDLFSKITVEYTRTFVEALKSQSPQATFCFLSGQGADSSENSRILFAREKGKAENIILQQSFSETAIFRPGYIYPVTPRDEPNLSYRIMRFLYKPASKILPNFGVESKTLANAMVKIAFEGGDKKIYEHKDILAIS